MGNSSAIREVVPGWVERTIPTMEKELKLDLSWLDKSDTWACYYCGKPLVFAVSPPGVALHCLFCPRVLEFDTITDMVEYLMRKVGIERPRPKYIPQKTIYKY